MVQDFGFGVQGSEFKVEGLRFRVQGLGVRVWDLGFGHPPECRVVLDAHLVEC